MGFWDRFRKPAGQPEQKGVPLVFDNYPFKLAIVQQLMYEKGLLGSKYAGGDAYFERYPDAAEASEEESLRRLVPVIEQGNRFFEGLEIPAALAGEVTELYIGVESDIYYQINPQWGDFDAFEDGKAFDITEVSERELRQFPALRRIVFNMYHTPSDTLVEKLKGFGLEAEVFD